MTSSIPTLRWCAAFPFVVGSASPRRHKLLRQLGLSFEVLAADASEIHDGNDPVGTVVHNALAKPARREPPEPSPLGSNRPREQAPRSP